MGDMQLSSSYIAYTLHALSDLASNTPVAVMGHSQANPDIQWALHFFPSTHSITSMYIGLSPDLTGIGFGTGFLRGLCDLGTDGQVSLCQPSLWQQLTGSNYHAALGKVLKSEIATTEIWSEVRRFPSATRPGHVPSLGLLLTQLNVPADGRSRCPLRAKRSASQRYLDRCAGPLPWPHN